MLTYFIEIVMEETNKIGLTSNSEVTSCSCAQNYAYMISFGGIKKMSEWSFALGVGCKINSNFHL